MNFLRRFWELLTSNSYTVKRASALLAVSALLSNVLGLFRNIIFYWLVPKPQLDIYFAAFRIPDFLFNIVIFGAVSSAFVPIASELLAQKKERQTNEITNQLLTWLTIFFVGVAIILAILMHPLMHIIVPGFDAVRFDETVMLSRILLLQSIFFAWSFTVGGYLNSTKRFSSYAMAPLVYNAVIIVGGFLAVKYGITAIAWAVVVGSFGHFAIQFRELLKTTYRPRWDIRFTKELRDISRLMIPRSLSQGIAQLVDIVYVALASGLAASSIAIFNGMNDIQTMPIQIIGNSLAVAIFPTLSAYVAKGNWDGANALINKALRTTLFILLPALVFAFVVRAQVVRLYFGLGYSTWEQTTLAIQTFVGFLAGIIPACFIAILSRVFYALKDTRTPMLLSGLAGLIGILYAIFAIHSGGTVVSLSIAESILMISQCILYGYVLYRSPHIRLGLLPVSSKIIHYFGTATLVGLITWATLNLTDWMYTHENLRGTHSTFGLFVQLVIASIVGVGSFLAYSRYVHKEELEWILKRNFSKTE